jgi:hypothetical protein
LTGKIEHAKLSGSNGDRRVNIENLEIAWEIFKLNSQPPKKSFQEIALYSSKLNHPK